MNVTSKKFKAICPGRLNSAKVVDGDVIYAIKAWKRILKDTNVMQECYDRKYYHKKSDVRRKQSDVAKYNQYKEISNEE